MLSQTFNNSTATLDFDFQHSKVLPQNESESSTNDSLNRGFHFCKFASRMGRLEECSRRLFGLFALKVKTFNNYRKTTIKRSTFSNWATLEIPRTTPSLTGGGGGSSSNENGIFTLVCLLYARGEIWTQASREQLENYLTWNKQHRREFAPSLFLFTDVIAVIFLINAINN